MRKSIVFTAVTALSIASASAAFAGSLALTADQKVVLAAGGDFVTTAAEPVYYPAEAVKGGDDVVNLSTGNLSGTPAAVGNVVANSAIRSIIYTPTTNLPSGTRIVFTLTNGQFKDAALYLLKQNNPGADADGITVASTDSIVGGVATFIVGSTPIDAGTKLIISSVQDVLVNTNLLAANPKISLDDAAKVAGSKVTLAVTQAFDSVGAIAGGLANAINVLGTYQQFAFTSTAGTSTIDVENPSLRTLFISEGAGSDTPATNTAGAFVKWADNQSAADVDSVLAGNQVANYAIDLATASLATFDFNVVGTQFDKLTKTGATITGMKLNRNNGGAAFQTFTATATTGTLSVATDDNVAWYDGTSELLQFTVNGTDVLNTQTITLASTLNFTDNTAYNDVTSSAATIDTWGINGYQAVIPYLYTGIASPIDSYCLVNNTSLNNTANVFVDILSSEGVVTGLSNLVIGTVDPQKSQMVKFQGNSIYFEGGAQTNQLATMGDNKRYSARITVTSPVASVTTNCFQIDPANGTKRVIPVYLNAGGGSGFLVN